MGVDSPEHKKDKKRIIVDLGGLGVRGNVLAEMNPESTVLTINPDPIDGDSPNQVFSRGRGESIPLESNSVSKVEISGIIQSLPISAKLKQRVQSGELDVSSVEYDTLARGDRLEIFFRILKEVHRILDKGGAIEILDGFLEHTSDNSSITGIDEIEAKLLELGFVEVNVREYSEGENQREKRTDFPRYFINRKARLISAKK
jgi:hypothetical protein